MSSVYFDQNVYDFCADQIPAVELRKILRHKNHELVLGTLNLLEVASCFKSGDRKKAERGKFLSQYFTSLLPIKMLLDINSLMMREVRQAIGQPPGSIYYEENDKRLFEEEIQKLARGIYDKTASEFIEKDWMGKIAYRQRIEDCLNKSGAIKLKDIRTLTFSDFLANHKVRYENFRKQWVHSMLKTQLNDCLGKIINAAVKRIVNRPHRYPYFALGPKIELFFFFKLGRDGALSQDMLIDLKHLLSAVHLDIFVSADQKLIKYAKDIWPERIVCKADEYFKECQGQTIK